MPPLSKVMRTSIVALGGSAFVLSLFEEVLVVVVLGANASRRRLEIFSVGHVVVIESGKFLCSGRQLATQPSSRRIIGQHIHIILHNVDILPPPQPQPHPALDQLPLARLAQPGRVAAAQAQDLDVVPQLGPRQGQHGGREEHGLVVRVGDEQADAPVAQGREPRGRDAHRVQV